MEDYQLGKTYIDPKHVSDGGVTPDHVRRWKVLQELQVTYCTQGNVCGHKVSFLGMPHLTYMIMLVTCWIATETADIQCWSCRVGCTACRYLCPLSILLWPTLSELLGFLGDEPEMSQDTTQTLRKLSVARRTGMRPYSIGSCWTTLWTWRLLCTLQQLAGRAW